MKTTHQILDMSERDLRRLVARLQVELADHQWGWSRGCAESGTLHLYDEALRNARLVKREIYQRFPSADPNALETLPKIAGGIDYGAYRLVLARNADSSVILWWRFCFTGWQGVGQAGHFPGELVLATNPNTQTGFDTRTLHSGGRLSAKLLAKHHDEIAAAFGIDSLDLHPRKTLFVTGP